MPTATLRYKLPEEEHEYRRAILGDLAIQTLWHVDQHCRGAVKARRREPRNGEAVAADSRNDPRRAFGRMNVQVKRIASDDNFLRMYQNGVSRQDLANYFGVPYQTINQVVEYMGLLPVNKNDLAPSPEEDKYSRENLMLSPRVFAAAEEYRQKYEKRKEAETAQCTYNRQYKLNLKRSLL
jgi:uncharacterized protein (DUF433 family)